MNAFYNGLIEWESVLYCTISVKSSGYCRDESKVSCGSMKVFVRLFLFGCDLGDGFVAFLFLPFLFPKTVQDPFVNKVE